MITNNSNSSNAVALDLVYGPNHQDFATLPAEVQAWCREALGTRELLAGEAGLAASEVPTGPSTALAGYGLSLATHGGVQFAWVCENGCAAVPANPFVVVAA